MSRKPIRRVSLSAAEQRAMALYLESMGGQGLAVCLGVSRSAIISAASGQPLSSREAATIRARISPPQLA
jgi:hypothetical protein